ncbi:YafY family protein [Streptomyces sp. AM 4-1-1]|uniref:helix-turn-helix transcriptional regulator n=1 Tax=Streptomyces sp. AM 4-1-1 TaxID=3028710 RepID=UPI0023BA26E2|nr:YafY family protein [Streptomyces sp. AM 4-1-1]WEH33027.1 YafY family protein [Streptomyces sp. AM 4-1-1]
MRAARLIKMVLILQSRAAMTAAELARELEVSERTVTRDAQALSEAGIPVYADRGRTGGYRLISGYRALPPSLKGIGGGPLTGLTREEAQALFLSGLPSALREMGLADTASSARLKVSEALLPSLRDASEAAARRFHLDAPGWYQDPRPPGLLPEIAEAVRGDRRLTARYRRGARDGERTADARPAGREVERELDPYGLVLKAGVWYLVARVGDDFRVYRIDRFSAATVSDERFVRDEGFDLAAFWADRSAGFARSLLRTEVVVRVSAAGARRLPYAVDREAALTALDAADGPDGEGRLTLTLPVESMDVAFGQLLTLGAQLEVLAPASLRDRFAATARRLRELYG